VAPLAILPVGCAPRSGSGRWWWVGHPAPWPLGWVGCRLGGGWLAVCAYFGSALPCRVSGSPL